MENSAAEKNMELGLAAILGRSGRKPKQTTVEDFLKESNLTEISRGAAVRFLRSLEQQGKGTFIPGRRGKPSRMEWNGSTAEPRIPKVERRQLQLNVSDEPIFHKFSLRPGLSVDLPARLSKDDAERLKRFIDAIVD
jgi:hypothetical protein